MLTSCSHSFCTLCIRRYLAQEGRCPTCRAGEQETKLRRNNALEELVDAFRGVRGRVLEVARGWRSFEDGMVDEDHSVREREGGKGKKGGRRMGSKRKAEEAGMDDCDGADGVGGEGEKEHVRGRTRPRTRTRTKTRSQRARARARGNDDGASQGTDGYLSGANVHVNGAREYTASVSTNGEDDEWEDPGGKSDKPVAAEEEASSGLVGCPICNRLMKVEAVDPHLDKCIAESSNLTKSTQPSKSTSSTSTASLPPFNNAVFPLPNRSANSTMSKALTPKQPPQQSRLAQLNYSLLRDRQLRQKLSDLGIPDWGTRALLIRRHTEWVNLHNANCDALRPRSKRELLKDLDTWERTLGGLAPSAASTATAAGHASGGGGSNYNGEGSGSNGSGAGAVMRKDFDGKGWARKNRDEFDELIAVARRSRERRTADGADDVCGVNGASGDGNGAAAPDTVATSVVPAATAAPATAPTLIPPNSNPNARPFTTPTASPSAIPTKQNTPGTTADPPEIIDLGNEATNHPSPPKFDINHTLNSPNQNKQQQASPAVNTTTVLL